MSDSEKRNKIKTITLFCGSKSGQLSVYVDMAKETGQLLASKDIEIIYGGGKVGMMGELADAALNNNGKVVGIIPSFLCTKEIAHDSLSELIVVETMHERKLLMQEGCQGFITMPGGFGTMEEFFEVLTWGQLGLHQKPIALLNAGGYFDPLIDFLDQMLAKGFVSKADRNMVLAADHPEELLEKMMTYTPPPVPQWLNPSTT
ncbi:MAG: TIGR00730 family Rossman fold protein [Crocinitomicaceae bacterium]